MVSTCGGLTIINSKFFNFDLSASAMPWRDGCILHFKLTYYDHKSI